MSRILITGGSGSLGHALVAHYLKTTDHRLIVYSRSEFHQAQMRDTFPDPRLDLFLGDVRDLPRLKLACSADVDVVIHAAALKRVDATSYNPDEILKTNVLGSRNVLIAARDTGVKRCLLISSDKACYSTNAYGASKALAEFLFTAFNVYSIPKGTMSAVVRWGNVLNSRGSVIPLWRAQLSAGQRMTLTDIRMSRFLITFQRAIEMIDTALEQMEGGEIFVPRLSAARMTDLADVVRAGQGPPWIEVGLRPGGEKLHETLLTEEEYARAVFEHAHAWVPPAVAPWTEKAPPRHWGEGLRLQSAWRSDTAPQLDLAALRELVEAL